MTEATGPGQQLALKCSHSADHRIPVGPAVQLQAKGFPQASEVIAKAGLTTQPVMDGGGSGERGAHGTLDTLSKHPRSGHTASPSPQALGAGCPLCPEHSVRAPSPP